MRKVRLLAGIAIALIIAGTGAILFPTVSNTIGTQIANSEVEQFETALDNIIQDDITAEEAKEQGRVDDDGYLIERSENGSIQRISSVPVLFKLDLDKLYKDSVSYNENLKKNQDKLLTNDYSYANPSINLSDYGIHTGIYGYVSAPSIGMKLPIYLGANDSNMSYGAAHLTFTSLPIGGKYSNCVLAGHTGYIGRIFFDNIRNLNIGNEIEITNFWETMTYKVVDTRIFKPNQAQAIFINSNRDILTLMTCVSNGSGGFNRYYVVCERK